MDTHQILDLFNLKKEDPEKKSVKKSGKSNINSLVDELGELWEENEYENRRFKTCYYWSRLRWFTFSHRI